MFNPAIEQLSFRSFRRLINFDESSFYADLYLNHPFQISNQRIAVRRLKKICDATFHLANQGGFQSMTLRKLSEETGMSMGGLYAYISSKDDLALLIYSSLNHYCQKQLDAFLLHDASPSEQLQVLLRCHIYLSELLQPWFYFAYMEARSLYNQKHLAIDSEMIMENKLTKLIKRGIDENEFDLPDGSAKMIRLNASLIKSMLQDWYLKRGKYQKRRVTVDQYANQLIEMTLRHLKYRELERISA